MVFSTNAFKIFIKPLSFNECWDWVFDRDERKWAMKRSKKYWAYQTELIKKMPDIEIPKPPLRLYLEFGFSYAGADIDNPVKPTIDSIKTKYKFDDNEIYEHVVRKSLVKKGEEYVAIKLENSPYGQKMLNAYRFR